MSEARDLQERLFRQIKGVIGPERSLVHEVVDLLDVSIDSAYRRIRGETDLSFIEAGKLASHFNIPLDHLNGGNTRGVTFLYPADNTANFEIDRFLQGLESDLETIESLNDPEVIYFTRELPILNYFQIPEIAAFKFFVWRKMNLGLESMEETFELANPHPQLLERGRRILHKYLRIPTLEIWNEDVLRVSMQQILFLLESGYFTHPEEALVLIDKFERLTQHIRAQATKGYKFLHETEAGGDMNNFQLFYNEAFLPQSIVFVKSGDVQATYLDHNILSYFKTLDPAFCGRTYSTLQEVMKRSQLISRVGEKGRNRFFQRALDPLKRARKGAERLL